MKLGSSFTVEKYNIVIGIILCSVKYKVLCVCDPSTADIVVYLCYFRLFI